MRLKWPKRIFGAALNRLLAPGICTSCGCALDQPHYICDCCREYLPRIPNPCGFCGQPAPDSAPVCPSCLLNPPRWQRIIAPYQYRGLVRQYLLQIKFGEALHLANGLCRESVDCIRGAATHPEALLPVPLHRNRWIERGYNQAAEIAICWSRLLDLPVDQQSLRRQRHTPSQSGLSASQRRDNVRNAFEYRPLKDYRHVAIIDDIVTTGSTAAEITRQLHRGGVEFVEVWALARVYRR